MVSIRSLAIVLSGGIAFLVAGFAIGFNSLFSDSALRSSGGGSFDTRNLVSIRSLAIVLSGVLVLEIGRLALQVSIRSLAIVLSGALQRQPLLILHGVSIRSLAIVLSGVEACLELTSARLGFNSLFSDSALRRSKFCFTKRS